jgi:hypothetical protein
VSGVSAQAVIPRIGLPLALIAVIACLAMTVAAVVSLALPGSELLPNRPGIADFLAIIAIVLAFPIVGLVIAWKRPTNPVGWLFLVTGLMMALNIFSAEYSGRVAFADASLPGAPLLAWAESMWLLGPLVALPLAIVLFPDGRLPSSRWRPALTVAVSLALIVTAMAALSPGDLVGYEGRIVNPLGAPGEVGRLAAWAAEVGTILQLLPSLIAIAAIGVRLRRAGGAERQQLKWLLYPLALFVTMISIGIAVASTQPALADDVVWMFTVALLALAAVPIAAGIAILRHRLYDIDVVIRRTVVYGAVVVILGISYVGLVLGFQGLLTWFSGGDTLPVALSTLLIAAMFVPVRTRVRQMVDRRFYRSRYDAQRTVESFAVGLRDEVELTAVRQALADTVGQAVRPASVGVWLRERRGP